MAPLIGAIVVVAVGGLFFAVLASQQKDGVDAAEDGPAQEKDPFADVDYEDGPRRMNPGGEPIGEVERSPKDLLETPLWVDALERAEEGYALHQAAQQAKREEESGVYLAKGVEAKKIFDQVLEDTAEWETEISNAYTEHDVRVSQVMDIRTRWFSVLGKYKGL